MEFTKNEFSIAADSRLVLPLVKPPMTRIARSPHLRRTMQFRRYWFRILFNPDGTKSGFWSEARRDLSLAPIPMVLMRSGNM